MSCVLCGERLGSAPPFLGGMTVVDITWGHQAEGNVVVIAVVPVDLTEGRW